MAPTCPLCHRFMVEAGNPNVGTGERVWMCEKDVLLLSDKDLEAVTQKRVPTWKESLLGAGLAIVLLLALFWFFWTIFYR